MELTQAQISEFIREQAGSPSGFNHLVELLLDSLMQHERTLYLASHEGDSGNGFRLRCFCYGQYEFSLKCLVAVKGTSTPHSWQSSSAKTKSAPACLQACIARA